MLCLKTAWSNRPITCLYFTAIPILVERVCGVQRGTGEENKGCHTSLHTQLTTAIVSHTASTLMGEATWANSFFQALSRCVVSSGFRTAIRMILGSL